MTRVRVQIVSAGGAPRALVVEEPSWLGVVLGAERSEWYAFAAPAPQGGIEWFRDSRDERPRRVVARRVLEALERELAGAAVGRAAANP
jgi:hypothetical protein